MAFAGRPRLVCRFARLLRAAPRSDWYFGTAGPVPAGRPDFYTRAQHELGRVLGYWRWNSSTTSFDRLVVDGKFTGPNVIARAGGPVPVQGRYEWATGVRDGGLSRRQPGPGRTGPHAP